MMQISVKLINKYTAVLDQNGVQKDSRSSYLKWLRYYIDFCHKYGFLHTEKHSLSAFMDKLKENRQAEYLMIQHHLCLTKYIVRKGF